MRITETRLVCQDWYETEFSKTGWESQGGWWFKDDNSPLDHNFEITEILKYDKFGNPVLGIAEKETEI